MTSYHVLVVSLAPEVQAADLSVISLDPWIRLRNSPCMFGPRAFPQAEHSFRKAPRNIGEREVISSLGRDSVGGPALSKNKIMFTML